LLSDAGGIHRYFVHTLWSQENIFLSNLGDGADYARSRLFVYAEIVALVALDAC